MKKKKVAIVGTNGIPARYGGFETLAENLTKELNEEFDFIVYCSKIQKPKLKSFNNSKLINLPLKANGLQSLIYDTLTTIHALIFYDIILLLGPAVGYVLVLNKLFKKKIIVNHGGLNEWEREKLSKREKRYAYLSHKIAAKYASVNIADNLPLAKSLSNIFGINTEVVEYGGDHIKNVLPSKDELDKFPFLGLDYDISVSRAQIDNNIHLLLEVYENIKDRNIVIVSNWNISEYGLQLKEKYKDKFPNIFIVDAIYDKNLLDVVRSNAKLYIHSHSQCGTAPSLVEAMNYNIPVICFDVETNRATTKDKSLYFHDKESLSVLLKSLNQQTLENLKSNMYEIAKTNYSWKNIAKKYKIIINTL
ncbi:glycosyltransferase family 1 protein [Paludibacter sp.]